MNYMLIGLLVLMSSVNSWAQVPKRVVKFNDSKCEALKGVCMDMARYTCSEPITPMKCGGPGYRLCCTADVKDIKTGQVVAKADVVERSATPTPPPAAAPAAQPKPEPSPSVDTCKDPGMATDKEWANWFKRCGPNSKKKSLSLDANKKYSKEEYLRLIEDRLVMKKETRIRRSMSLLEAAGSFAVTLAIRGLCEKDARTPKKKWIAAGIVGGIALGWSHNSDINTNTDTAKYGSILGGAILGLAPVIPHKEPYSQSSSPSPSQPVVVINPPPPPAP